MKNKNTKKQNIFSAFAKEELIKVKGIYGAGPGCGGGSPKPCKWPPRS